jgi:DNA-binding PadR family transcriptional regulator
VPRVAAALPVLSLADWTVLGVVAEEPTHGWAVTRELHANGVLGRVWTVPRPVVYRSLATLASKGLIEDCGEAPGARGPQRTIVRATPRGRAALRQWLERPVGHVRDLRSELLVKLVLLDRAGHPSDELVQRQLERLAPVFAALRKRPREGDAEDVLTLWRRESALAARRFLETLARRPR